MSGTGSVNLIVTALPDPDCTGRSCTLAIAGRDLTVNQAGNGTITLAPPAWNPPDSLSSQMITVTASTSCGWSVSNPCTTWLSVSPMSGAGNDQATFTAQPNPSCLPRSCTVTVGGSPFDVTQSGIGRIPIRAILNGSQLMLCWTNPGWNLQVQTNPFGVGLSTNWFTVPGCDLTNQTLIGITGDSPAVFYRLVHP